MLSLPGPAPEQRSGLRGASHHVKEDFLPWQKASFRDGSGLDLNKWGYTVVNEETGETSIPGVFAGEDIATGAATVISATGAGRRAAKEIAQRLLGDS